MTKTEKLAVELFDVHCKACLRALNIHQQLDYDALIPETKVGWTALARHVLRREARLRKARR